MVSSPRRFAQNHVSRLPPIAALITTARPSHGMRHLLQSPEMKDDRMLPPVKELDFGGSGVGGKHSQSRSESRYAIIPPIMHDSTQACPPVPHLAHPSTNNNDTNHKQADLLQPPAPHIPRLHSALPLWDHDDEPPYPGPADGPNHVDFDEPLHNFWDRQGQGNNVDARGMVDQHVLQQQDRYDPVYDAKSTPTAAGQEGGQLGLYEDGREDGHNQRDYRIQQDKSHHRYDLRQDSNSARARGQRQNHPGQDRQEHGYDDEQEDEINQDEDNNHTNYQEYDGAHNRNQTQEQEQEQEQDAALKETQQQNRAQTPPPSLGHNRALTTLSKSLSSPIPHGPGISVSRIGGRNRLTRATDSKSSIGTQAAFAPYKHLAISPSGSSEITQLGNTSKAGNKPLPPKPQQYQQQEQQAPGSSRKTGGRPRKWSAKADINNLLNDGESQGQQDSNAQLGAKRSLDSTDLVESQLEQNSNRAKRTAHREEWQDEDGVAENADESMEQTEPETEGEQEPFDPVSEVPIYQWQTELVQPWTELQKENVEFIKTFSENVIRHAIDLICTVNALIQEKATEHAESMGKKVEQVEEEETKQQEARSVFVRFKQSMIDASSRLAAVQNQKAGGYNSQNQYS